MKRKNIEKIILYMAVFVMAISSWTTALAETEMTAVEEQGSFLLLKADGEEMGGNGVIRLNLEIANRKEEGLYISSNSVTSTPPRNTPRSSRPCWALTTTKP